MGTSAEKLDYSLETKALIKAEINRINNVLTDASTFRSYAENLYKGYIDILNNGTINLWNNLKHTHNQGTTLTLYETDEAPIKLTLSGNTIQDNTTLPSPNNPIEVNNVKGNNSITISNLDNASEIIYPINLIGENIFDKNNANIINGWINADTGFLKRDTFNITVWVKTKLNTTYKIKKMLSLPTNRSRLRAGTLDTYPSSSDITLSNLTLNDVGEEVIINTGNTGNYLLAFVWTDKSTTTVEEVLDSLEITELHPVFEELNTNDRLFKAIEGDSYYDSLTQPQKNSLEYNKWYLYKEINKITLDGNESWYQGSSSITDVFYIQSIVDYATTNNIPFCKYFKGIANVSGLSEMSAQANNTIAFIDNTENLRFYIKTSDFTLADFKTWLQNNPIDIYYKLAIPLFICLDDLTLITQLEALKNARSIYNKTYIFQQNSDMPFILDVQAVKKF